MPASSSACRESPSRRSRGSDGAHCRARLSGVRIAPTRLDPSQFAADPARQVVIVDPDQDADDDDYPEHRGWAPEGKENPAADRDEPAGERGAPEQGRDARVDP